MLKEKVVEASNSLLYSMSKVKRKKLTIFSITKYRKQTSVQFRKNEDTKLFG